MTTSLNPAAPEEFAQAINSHGIVAGFYFPGGGNVGDNINHAIVTDDKSTYDLGVLGGGAKGRSSAVGVNNLGDVIGQSTWFGIPVPVLWRRLQQ